MKLNEIHIGQSVVVTSSAGFRDAYEFLATVAAFNLSEGTVTVRDQDDDCFDVDPDELSIDEDV